jgi:4-hydroxy-tetrahydrodipicolinate reductase
MGRAVAEAAIDAGLHIVPFGLTGPGLGGIAVDIRDVQVQLHDVSEKETVVDKVLDKYPDVIIVDYTLPAAVNGKHM